MPAPDADFADAFTPTRHAGRERLAGFVARAGRAYARSRNFDLGPGRRSNVSLLSPYIRHRLITEEEVLAAVLEQHDRGAAGKFIDEVFWRAYFKGWLEHRPSVWTRYRQDLGILVDSLDTDADLRERYESAVAGRTGIDCFDSWANELVHTGYLHNHARMWFASIWVYTLRLPWQLGADFFHRNLLDGDPASNTLGWRWVCGLHTKGKTYLARASNIANYTDFRFNPEKQLAATAPPLDETEEHPVRTMRDVSVPGDLQRFGLLITEEDCSPATLGLPGMPVRVLGAVATESRSPLAIGKPAKTFALGAVVDALDGACRHFHVPGEMSPTNDWGAAISRWASEHELDAIVTAYAPVGPVFDALQRARRHLSGKGVPLIEVQRAYDGLCWPHAARGYFKLKARIPRLLDAIEANHAAGARSRAVG